MTYLLFPGRHHLLTNFQYEYINNLIQSKLENIKDINQNAIDLNGSIISIIFAITSANHSNTRRNPTPLHLRAMAIHDFSKSFQCPSYLYDIDDVGVLNNFAEYTIKRIYIRSNQRHLLNPKNTIVLCSTSNVIKMYETLGYKILPAELINREKEIFINKLPWEIVSLLSTNKNWRDSIIFKKEVHAATQRVWLTYDIGDFINMLFNDDLIGADGDLTETRDYNSYVRGMDEIATTKYNETKNFIRAGRIGDILSEDN